MYCAWFRHTPIEGHFTLFLFFSVTGSAVIIFTSTVPLWLHVCAVWWMKVRLPEFLSCLCHSVTVEPWKSSITSLSPVAAAKTLQSCPTVWTHRRQPTRLPCPWDSPGKNARVGCHFLLQCMKGKVKSLSHARLLATPWTAAYQAPPFMGFSRQEYWSGVPLPSPVTSFLKWN